MRERDALFKRKIDFSECMEKQSGPETVDCKRTAAGGKTESIRRFGEQNYKSVISINFVEEPKYK